MEKVKPVANYRKAEEHIVHSYEEAEKLADQLFEPFGKKDRYGSRTSEKAKVRIRRRAAHNANREAFRVVLSKRIEVKEEKANEDKPKKRRPKARKDRKGRKKQQAERAAGGKKPQTSGRVSGGAQRRPATEETII